MTQEQISEILDEHNKFRALVASGNANNLPKSSNMRAMKWNENLAQVAQKWADQCIYDHDHNEQR